MNANDKEYLAFKELWLRCERLLHGKTSVNGTDIAFLYQKFKSKGFTFAQIAKAINDHLDNCSFAPTPENIISRIIGNANDRAENAWDCVLRNLDYARSIDFSGRSDAAAIVYAIEQEGGWVKLSTMLEKDVQYVEKRFKDRYKYAVDNEFIRQKGLTRLAGTQEMTNGFANESSVIKISGRETKMIGGQNAIMQIEGGGNGSDNND